MAKLESPQLAQISVRGVVQGVGFRPFVYQLATKYHLSGWVCNTSEDVKIEVEGSRQSLDRFLFELENDTPPLARIERISHRYYPPAGHAGFEIRHSLAEEGKYQLVSPDIATCQPCLREVFDPADRRYRYPFTNCTNCGPRFTIISDIPYDRPLTTMHRFRMCPRCQAEYDNPLDRRFHAQPNACPDCGPALQLLDTRGKPQTTQDAITTASHLLKEGKIVAVKGLGGFLLACDATSGRAVNLLRQRKQRPFKPLAIMVSSLDESRRYCEVSEKEVAVLTSPQSPIVLLRWQSGSPIAESVAPNLKYLGVMLPYTPLHHLLLHETGLPLVMTSGNLSEEPIAKDNDEALRRLSAIADYFLVHNRDIHARYDDSVTMVESDSPQILRRARGYAPYPVHLSFDAHQALGCGAEEKNTFCLTRDNYAFLSQHIGDMENLETLEHFENTVTLYKRLFRIEPAIVAHDLHPDYLATKYAQRLADEQSNIRLVPIQHHHAHTVSCMIDNGVDSPVIGVAFDGTGYGDDGNIWGGEFLVADYKGYQRLGHLEYLPLPGGATAIRRPYRTAIGYIIALLGEDQLQNIPPLPYQVDTAEIDIIKQQIRQKLNSPLTSSMGRLFDAVSALIGIRGEIDYEGQAAVELEMAAYGAMNEVGGKGYPYSIAEHDGIHIIQLKELFMAIIRDLQQGVSKSTISVKFHNSVSLMVLDLCQVIARTTGIKQVTLSGGVFQNRLLLRTVVPLLKRQGFLVLIHQQVPTNDGGISLGQAVVANFAVDT
ncbi:MAG TPA: carbamoyltransferase HypF [Dehalococcoidia bacterium]|nr:carbamoyltransferase HypF [Dehalococcoidia bacterium]